MRALRPFAVAVGTATRRVTADRSGLIVSGGFYLVVVSVLGALWRAAAAANGGNVAGYSGAALTWYICTSEAATVSLNIRMIEEIGDDIAGGAVAVELLRPISALGVRVAAAFGTALPRLITCAVAGVAVATITVGAPPRAAALALAAPSLALGVVANIVAQHAFAASAFWVRDARSTWFLYQKFVFILGGMLLPLEVLPGGLQTVAKALPFMAMSYAPARLASGHFEPWLLGAQLAWIVVLGAMASIVFGAGERRLQTVGG